MGKQGTLTENISLNDTCMPLIGRKMGPQIHICPQEFYTGSLAKMSNMKGGVHEKRAHLQTPAHFFKEFTPTNYGVWKKQCTMKIREKRKFLSQIGRDTSTPPLPRKETQTDRQRSL